jgi:uncharacterized protein
MATIGKRNQLKIVREASPGLYLDDGEGGEILLPGRYIPKGSKPGDVLDVFVYLDSEDRPVATTETPLAMAGDFAALRVVSVNERVGAFLDWGLMKDLLLPFREQVGPVYEGEKVVVYIYLDEKSTRLVASMRLNKHLCKGKAPYKNGEEVSLLITSKTPLGYNVIVENQYGGLLYHSNLAGPLEIGKKMKGFVHSIRPDFKIDLRLDASGYKERVAPLKEQILLALKAGGGRFDFDIKSSPEKIRNAFGVSKNTFKEALSGLYKDRVVVFRNGGTELVKQ